jgi:hypothetical protein
VTIKTVAVKHLSLTIIAVVNAIRRTNGEVVIRMFCPECKEPIELTPRYVTTNYYECKKCNVIWTIIKYEIRGKL